MLGRDGYAKIAGLGGNYGLESLTVGKRHTPGTAPHETVTTFPEPDLSWDADWRDLVASIEEGRAPEVDATAGYAVMKMVGDVYARAADSRAIAGLVPSR